MDSFLKQIASRSDRDFVSGVAHALEEMHFRRRAHGGISFVRSRDWFNDARDGFSPTRFEAAAIPEDQLPPDPFHADVLAFVDYSILMVRGAASGPGERFRAVQHRGFSWPLPFLELLESVYERLPGAPITMDRFVQALTPAHDSVHLATASAVSHPRPPTAQAPAAQAPTAQAPAAQAAAAQAPAAQAPAQAPAKKVPQAPAPTRPAASINVVMRNATVGKPYRIEPGEIATAIAKQRGETPAGARLSQLDLPADCGLVFDPATGVVSGIPVRPFDSTVLLEYLPPDRGTAIAGKAALLINPDPASLWKDLPIPASAPYQKPSIDAFEQDCGSLRVTAASRRGRSHANKGEFRDDDFAVGYATQFGWVVVAVADGAGSAMYSRRGSQIASKAARDRLTTVLNSGAHNEVETLYAKHSDWEHPEIAGSLRRLLYEAALDAHHKLRAEVSAPSEALPTAPVLRNYDTTLVLLVIKSVAQGCVAASFAIGDGGAGIVARSGDGFPITRPELGEYAGQTFFLTMPETLKNDEVSLQSRFHFSFSRAFRAAYVMTDGITDPKFPSDALYGDPARWGEFHAEIEALPDGPEALLEWMNFFSPGNHDDRTLVVVKSAAAPQPVLQ
jgi:hypothetical protein